jgi:hypothetical protein
MNFEETKIYELEKKLGFSCKTDLPILFIVLVCVFLISDIVNLLHNIYTPWENSLKKIIEQAYSTRYFSKSIYFIVLLIIITISSIWPFFRRYRICLKIVNLRKKQLSACRSENKSLLLRGQPSIVVNNIINPYSEADTPASSEINTSFEPTPGTPNRPETKNETDHTTIPTSVAKSIDSGKVETLDTANNTANLPNEDQE